MQVTYADEFIKEDLTQVRPVRCVEREDACGALRRERDFLPLSGRHKGGFDGLRISSVDGIWFVSRIRHTLMLVFH